jgi:hypothetical protein
VVGAGCRGVETVGDRRVRGTVGGRRTVREREEDGRREGGREGGREGEGVVWDGTIDRVALSLPPVQRKAGTRNRTGAVGKACIRATSG